MAKGVDDLAEDPDLANLDETEMATNQEAVVLPWLAGEAKVALLWLSPPYDQFTRNAPVARPGKK